MKNLSEKELIQKVKNRDYTDFEWNQYNLWRYVNYKSKAVGIYTNRNKNG